MKLSPHFSLAEMTTTSQPYLNAPNAAEIGRLSALCYSVLEPLRAELGFPLAVTSGFRSATVNAAVGGSTTSQHRSGDAADVKPIGVNRLALWAVILRCLESLDLDQCIIYEATGHVHVSHDESPRRQLLVKVSGTGRYVQWERYAGPLADQVKAYQQ